jgi:hypothetical protein
MILAFKETWHQSDLEPGARGRYLEAMALAEKMDECLCRKWPLFVLGPTLFLDVNPGAHRRVFRDMRKAFSMMALFFPAGVEKFVDEYEGDLLGHMIINQGERAKNPPDRRTPQSNKTRPAEFWKERHRVKETREEFPEEWDKAIRPIIAHREICPVVWKSNDDVTDTWNA